MNNAVADKYRSYGTGNLKFNSYSEKNAAQRELLAEENRLQSEIDKYENIYNEYQNNVMPYLTSINDDFDGFIINKMKNAEKFLDEGYEGDKSRELAETLFGYRDQLNTCKNQVVNLKGKVEIRKREVSIKKRNYENQLSDVRSVSNRVRNTGVYQEPGSPTSFTY